VLMYLLLFIAGLKIIISCDKILLIPGGKLSALLVLFLGFVGCITAIVVGFFPPNNINVGGDAHYIILFTTGLLLMIAPVIGLILCKKLFRAKQNKG